jgi:hypothetical protein
VVNVKSTQNLIDFQSHLYAQITWQVPRSIELSILIVDLEGLVVKTLMAQMPVEAGVHTIKWNGYDDHGNRCSDGVYLPIRISYAGSEASLAYNPSEQPWGETVQPKDLYYDQKAKSVHYRLEKAALCRIRTGEYEGGPLYRTLVNWGYRNPGTHDEPWDGMDEYGVVAITKKPKHYIVVDAFSLPENAIIVSNGDVKRGKTLSTNTYQVEIKPPHGRNVNAHAFHAGRDCQDFPVSVKLLPSSNSGIPALSGIVHLQVFEPTGIRSTLLQTKTLELYLFGDGKFLYEVLPEKLPAEINLDTHQLGNGKHVLTVNVRTGEDHIGIWSKGILISND